MPISSSSVIHFTRTKAALAGILTDNFKLKYCLETIRTKVNDNVFAFPMVSFCDIPLSQVKEHTDKYGFYGIGLTKEWAKQQQLSPVQYVATGSLYAISLTKVLRLGPKGDFKWNELTDDQIALVDIIRYLKNYEGDLKRNGDTQPNYRYYDEREWRYVPSYCGDFPMYVREKAYDTKAKKQDLNTKLSKIRLEFEPSDIKYIIVKSEADIPYFVEKIRNTKGRKYSLHETELLLTRIVTNEQIENDF